MPDTNISSAETSDLATAFTDFSVDSKTTDGAGSQKEFSYQNPNWTQDYGYFNSIPELKRAITTKATWTVGAGFTADASTMLILNNIRGNGKESFNSIMANLIKVKTFGQDSFAEIIQNDEGLLINLKVLDPSSMVIVQNSKGMIIRYEQVSKLDKKRRKFKPEQIFHLSHERIADEIHGSRIIDSLKWLIDARNEGMTDWRRVLHRNVDPVRIFELDEDDEDKVKAFKKKQDAARGNSENMYIPKGAVIVTTDAVAINSTLNPITWIGMLNDAFFQAVNTPQIIVGNAKEFTDASGKIVYLAFEQNTKAEQLYIEEMVLLQLNLEIQLTFPASLQNELISDDVKGGPLEATKPNDTTVEIEGKT